MGAAFRRDARHDREPDTGGDAAEHAVEGSHFDDRHGRHAGAAQPLLGLRPVGTAVTEGDQRGRQILILRTDPHQCLAERLGAVERIMVDLARDEGGVRVTVEDGGNQLVRGTGR